MCSVKTRFGGKRKKTVLFEEKVSGRFYPMDNYFTFGQFSVNVLMSCAIDVATNGMKRER